LLVKLRCEASCPSAHIVGQPTDGYNSTVSRLLVKIFSLMGVLISPTLAVSEPSLRIETMEGRVVAYSNGLTCLNGSEYWSMLIHVQDHATDFQSQSIEVRFSLPCNKSPEWITRKSSLQKFRLTRDHDADSILKEFVECVVGSPSGHASESRPHLPIWKLVPGTEHEKLPFGQRVPSYHSVELPLAPVV
jgi:hypothetical protein